MSARQKLPPPVEPDLPPFNPPSQTSINNSLADVDPNYVPPMNDEYLDTAPEEVVNDVQAQPEVRRAEANVVPTGVAMDLAFFNKLNSARSQEEFNAMYDALPDVQKHVYDRSFGQKITPAWAAQKADEFFKMQDERAKAQSGPEAKAAQEQALQGVQSAFDNADKIVSIMDRLRGYEKGAKGTENKTPKYFGRVGPIDSAFPESLSGDRKSWFIDFKALQDQLALAERGAIKGQGSISNFEQEMLRNAAMGGLDYGRDDASFAQVFEQTYDIAKRKRDEHKNKLTSLKSGVASAPASPSRSMPSFTIGQKLTDRFGNVRVYRGTDQNGQPILDPVQ